MISLIDNEKKSIKMAIYFLTNSNIAHALISASERGVAVVLVVDKKAADNEHSKVGTIEKAGISVTRKGGKNGGIMHNKFIIFEQNESPLLSHSRALVWTGSFNATKRANTKNYENVIVTTEPLVITEYTEYFDLLNQTTIKTEKRHHPKKNKH